MDDSGCWFPLPVMRRLADEGVFELGPRFHGFPTNRSQQRAREVDAPDLLARCRADDAQAALLVANCPVCHQSLSLAARHLEAHGIATVILGCARDIVEYCGVPRFLFSDFPLGNAAGRPRDPASQGQTLLLALALLQNAREPRTTWQSPLVWQGARQTGKRIMPMGNAFRPRSWHGFAPKWKERGSPQRHSSQHVDPLFSKPSVRLHVHHFV